MPRSGSIARRRPRHAPALRRGASAVEYMLVLTLVVIPIALWTPILVHMIVVYAGRVIWVVRNPFG